MSLLCWLPSFAAFLLCLKYSGNAEVYAAIMQSIKPYADYHNVIEFFTFDSLSVMRMHLHYNFFAYDYRQHRQYIGYALLWSQRYIAICTFVRFTTRTYQLFCTTVILDAMSNTNVYDSFD